MQSAIKHHPLADAHIVCVGTPSPSLRIINTKIKVWELEDFPRVKQIFEEVQKNRTYLESLISIKPSLLIEFQGKANRAEVVVYLDTDLFFFSPLTEFNEQHQDSDVIAVQHMYPKAQTKFPHGRFNAGFIFARKSNQALAILQRWESLCISWCKLSINDGRYADQGYLEEILSMPKGKGVKSEVVNVGMHYLRRGPRVTDRRGIPFINEKPLVAFHFHGFGIRGGLIWTGLNRYGFGLRNLKVFKIIYKPLIAELFKTMKKSGEFKNSEKSNKFKLEAGKVLVRIAKKTVIKIPKL